MSENFKLHPFTLKSAGIEPAGTPWNITQTNAPAFRKHAEGISPVVAVIDTGIDAAHPEFAGRIFMPRTFDGTAMGDPVGHGTHVAGTIAGKTKGMMPMARIMPLKVTFGTSQTNIQIWDAFLAILDHNKKCRDEDKVVAVNCSWDGPVDPFINYYIRELTETGVSVVVAAGNRGDGDPSTHECFGYPAYLWEVITTAALNQDGTPAGFSSSFDGVDISAPGVNVVSAAPGGDFVAMSGTSMATPHITGAIALLQAAFRKKYGRWATCEEIEQVLWKCVKPLAADDKLVGRGALFLPGEIVTTETKQADTVPFINKDNRTMVPLRFMAESLGAKVDGSKLPKVSAQLGDRLVTMTIDSKEYAVEEYLF